MHSSEESPGNLYELLAQLQIVYILLGLRVRKYFNTNYYMKVFKSISVLILELNLGILPCMNHLPSNLDMLIFHIHAPNNLRHVFNLEMYFGKDSSHPLNS